MTTWESHIAATEETEFDKWADIVLDHIWSALVAVTYRRGGCFRITLSPKDGDLMECGCYGIDAIKVADLDKIDVTFVQHWARDWCDTCQEAHRISDFTEYCESTDSDVDHEDRRESVTLDIPAKIQEEPGDGSTLEYINFAQTLTEKCEAWSEQEATR